MRHTHFNSRTGGIPLIVWGVVATLGVGAAATTTDIGQELTGAVLKSVFEMWAASAGPVVDRLLSSFAPDVDWSFIQPYLVFIDYWFPVNLALTLLGIYLTFMALFILIKFILKIIPTIG